MAKNKTKKVVKKEEKIDGLNPKDIQNIRSAIRQVWSWSVPARLVRKRCVGEDGFPRCENKKCASKGKPVPKVFVDHIEVMGDLLSPDYIKRMWTPSKNLQGLCKKCHDAKTALEKKRAKREAELAPPVHFDCKFEPFRNFTVTPEGIFFDDYEDEK